MHLPLQLLRLPPRFPAHFLTLSLTKLGHLEANAAMPTFDIGQPLIHNFLSTTHLAATHSISTSVTVPIQRRKCTQECFFKPYFPSNNPQRFLCVHKVFSTSNVAKLLNEVTESQREDTVSSLAYEAEARLQDPVYGCVGLISSLQDKLKTVQNELNNAKKDLASYIGPRAYLPLPTPPLPPAAVNPFYTQQQQSGPSRSEEPRVREDRHVDRDREKSRERGTDGERERD